MSILTALLVDWCELSYCTERAEFTLKRKQLLKIKSTMALPLQEIDSLRLDPRKIERRHTCILIIKTQQGDEHEIDLNAKYEALGDVAQFVENLQKAKD